MLNVKHDKVARLLIEARHQVRLFYRTFLCRLFIAFFVQAVTFDIFFDYEGTR